MLHSDRPTDAVIETTVYRLATISTPSLSPPPGLLSLAAQLRFPWEGAVVERYIVICLNFRQLNGGQCNIDDDTPLIP